MEDFFVFDGSGDITRLPQFKKKAVDLLGDDGAPDPRIPTPQGPGYCVEGNKEVTDGKNNEKLVLSSNKEAYHHLQPTRTAYFNCTFNFNGNQVCFFCVFVEKVVFFGF